MMGPCLLREDMYMKKPKVKSILFIYVLGGIVLLLFAVDTFLSRNDPQNYATILNVLNVARLIVTLTLVGCCSYYAFQTQKTSSIMNHLETMINAEVHIPNKSVHFDTLQPGMVLKEDILNHADEILMPKGTELSASLIQTLGKLYKQGQCARSQLDVLIKNK